MACKCSYSARILSMEFINSDGSRLLFQPEHNFAVKPQVRFYLYLYDQNIFNNAH